MLSEIFLEYRVYYPSLKSTPADDLTERWQAIKNWLEREIGIEYIDWEYEWFESLCFYFKNEEDEMKFILRWL